MAEHAAAPSRGTAVVAGLAYVLALAGAGALGLLVFGLGLGCWPAREGGRPVAIDLGWLAAFGVQHSLMARAGAKGWWERAVPARLGRSAYAAASGVVLLGLVHGWRTVPGPPLWETSRGLVALALVAGLVLAVIHVWFDHAGQFGLRQVWEAAPAAEPLLVVGPYRWVRHPQMACLLVLLWAQPALSPTLALLSGGLSAYVMVGIGLEERDLLRRYGAAYAAYRRRVPALIPWRRPVPMSVHPELAPCPAPPR